MLPHPVISAVGHETDYTIADFVADRRAATPSEAAELAVCDVRLVMERISSHKDRLFRAFFQKMEDMQERLAYIEERLRFLNPQNQLLQKRQYLTDMEERLLGYMEQAVKDKKYAFSLLAGRLDAMSPLKRLEGGYAFIEHRDGTMIDSIEGFSEGELFTVTMRDGFVEAQAVKVISQDRK